ncbi:MAG: site-specific integrase [Byssovorax sp.]
MRARADGYAAASKASATPAAPTIARGTPSPHGLPISAPLPRPRGERRRLRGAPRRRGPRPGIGGPRTRRPRVNVRAAGFPGLRKHPRVKAVREGFRPRLGDRAAGRRSPSQRPSLGRPRRAPVDARRGEGSRPAPRGGFAAALRRSEIVALDVAHVRFVDEGAIVHLERSKVDQEGEGRDVADPVRLPRSSLPVRALRAWLALAGITAGPIFRSVGKAGRLSVERLSDRSVALIVKAAVERAEIDPAGFSGHSLRAGFATSAARAGVALPDLMRQTGHKKAETALRYVREADLFRRNAAAGLL